MPDGQEPEPEASPAPNGKPDSMTPELWREKDRAHNLSIETQVAFKGIIELGKCYLEKGNVTIDIPKLADVFDAALDYAMERLQPNKTTTAPAHKPILEAPKSKSEASKGEKEPLLSTDGKNFKNVGELFTEAQKIGIQRQKVLDICQVKSSNDLTDLAGAWELVKDYKENNEEKPVEAQEDLPF